MWDDSDYYDLRRAAKRDFRRVAIALILQETLLVLTAYGVQDALAAYYRASRPSLSLSEVYELVWNTGFDMIAATLVGLAAVLLLIGGRMRLTPGERFGARRLLVAVVGVNGMQLLATLVTIPLENFVESLGYSLEQATEMSTGTSESVSMFVYSVIVAPLVEEVVFRGAVQRWLLPWGRGFALFASAALFGLMHNNLVQLPVAVACGLLFGYIAQRFSLRASILAHAANNLIVEIIGLLPDEWDAVWMAYSIMMLLSAAYLLYWCLTRRAELIAWCRGDGIPAGRWFLTSIPVLLLLAMYIVRTLQSAVPV